ncbi:hypothetical protein CONLIGDRAFT_234729 [Coniochaeta ligniaria NRRL 30616]|uniref:Uncharacterized protein n=1 Tax=Coniochaeta ligniaria NRRL 30616 TaxID=1408157 RepID=A0A1J7IW00_9PEZI|nr:hypothetical protein CONLIGDRAFT_234729 [Coniochaeta ligniaria NRRL 30616]
MIGPQPAVNFGTFTKSTSLSLTQLRANGTISGTDVVKMLLSAPHLKELALDCYLDVDDPGSTRERWNPINFVHDLCQLYGESGGAPLKLRRLQLGPHTQLFGMRHMWLLHAALGEMDGVLTIDDIPAAHDQPTALYLEKLCDLSALEELSVGNSLHNFYVSIYEPAYSFMRLLARGFAWETFTKERAPRLRRLWVTQLDDDVFDWMQDHVASSDGYGEQMAISYGSQVQQYGSLADLLGNGWRPKELEVDLCDDGRSRKQSIDHIVACGSQLEGLTLVPLLSDADDECKVYGGLIAQLPRLKVFRLRRTVFEPYRFLNLEDLPSSFSEPDLVLLTHLVRQSSSLRYIMVGAFAWSVTRNQDGHAVKLVGMSSSEWEDIELFRPHPFLHLYDKQKPIRQKGYRVYERVPWSPRRPRDLMLPKSGRQEELTPNTPKPEYKCIWTVEFSIFVTAIQWRITTSFFTANNTLQLLVNQATHHWAAMPLAQQRNWK